ncbi:nucleotide-binding protein [Mycobacterium sp. MBM]|nr:nucleotide-binding protein [Mycobacterium sp. MBM]
MAFDGGWELTHAEERTYVLSHQLDYDAKNVRIVALTRTTGKPGGHSGTTEELPVREDAVVTAGSELLVDLAPAWQDAPLPFRLKIVWHDMYGELFHATPEVPRPNRPPRTRPDLRSPIPPGFAARAAQLASRAGKSTDSVGAHQYAVPVPVVNPKKVFVVVGRNTAASDSMFSFLRAIGLDPIEWSEAVGLTGSGSPYIGQALDAAFATAQAFVVLMTPDDQAQLLREFASDDNDPELVPKGQARPNVLFEAGMALGRHPDRTILVELGSLRPFSDVAGRHTVRLDNSAPKRNELASRLRTAGCDVNTSGNDWYRAGDFTPPKASSGPLPTGRRLPSSTKPRKNHLDARVLHRSSGSDRLQLINVGTDDVYELRSPNADQLQGRLDGFPIQRLPAGKSINLNLIQVWGTQNTFDLTVEGRTEDGETFSESLFLDLNG